jgi:hypothetical protein
MKLLHPRLARLVISFVIAATALVPASATPAWAKDTPNSRTTKPGRVETAANSSDALAVDPAFPSTWPRWRFLAQNPLTHSRWAMDVRFSGGDGTQVQLWAQNSGDAQLWYEESASEGGAYLHPAYNRWLCLGRTTQGEGALLRAQNCNGSVFQRFHIIWTIGRSAREIRSVADSLCIDVQYGNFTSGTPLWLWGCHRGAAQRWIRPAPARDDSRNETVYLIHGYHPWGGYNCDSYWYDAISKMTSWGWTNFRKIGYYAADGSSCNVRIEEGTTETGLRYLGQRLAWDIFNNYTSQQVSVDLMGHSMGGLIARAAINGVRNGSAEDPDWPPYLYVEDVVTLGTPHDGTDFAAFCATISHLQCQQMRYGSGFLNWLSESENPQSTQGTDWTVIGSGDDGIISQSSALGMSAGHSVWYYGGQGLCHDCLQHVASGSFTLMAWNYHNGNNYYPGTGGSPIASASNALHNYWYW